MVKNERTGIKLEIEIGIGIEDDKAIENYVRRGKREKDEISWAHYSWYVYGNARFLARALNCSFQQLLSPLIRKTIRTLTETNRHEKKNRERERKRD